MDPFTAQQLAFIRNYDRASAYFGSTDVHSSPYGPNIPGAGVIYGGASGASPYTLPAGYCPAGIMYPRPGGGLGPTFHGWNAHHVNWPPY